ncbi:MAG: hypothetical protein GX785_03070 [Armatimonadetes bacterium]|jgi:neutral ceramidase|nr:hypothetical protein [Armatimonadota bacterium]HOM82636.1 hypothetical protein [Armatimonadota bacterium]HPO72123.1 hypothetical protein [Armatimonadota bacterium]
MQAGYAQIDITPPPGEELTGYGYFLNRYATGTLDPLMARAVALSDGERRAVIVQIDLLCLSKELTEAIRAEAEERLGLPREYLLLHCTHTHTGPAARPLYGCGMPSEEYLPVLRRKVLQAVEGALADLRPVGRAMRFEADFPEGFAFNRVGGTDLDTHVRGCQLEIPGARPISILSYACHPVTLGRAAHYSADYPGALMAEMNAYGIRAIYLNGCCGDINPLARSGPWVHGTPETVRIYGRDLAAAFRRAASSGIAWEPGPIRAVSRMVPLQPAMPARPELEAALAEVRAQLRARLADGPQRVNEIWYERMIHLVDAGLLAEEMAAEIQAVACGDVIFVGLAAETFTRLGQIVREGAPNRHLMIAATSNGVLGYIASREDVEKGGYAATAACKIYGMPLPSPGAGEEWAAEGARIVQSVM